MNTATAAQIANEINKAGEKYYGDRARGWDGGSESRIYFGRNFVRLQDGALSNNVAGKARALTIGHPAVEICERAIARLSAALA